VKTEIDNSQELDLLVVEKQQDTRIIRKSNDEIGYKVKSGHLSLLSRKLFNILIWHAQDMRDQEDEDGRWCVTVAQLIKDAKFKSKDYDLLRASLDELQEVRVIRPRRSGGITSEVLIPSFTLDNVAHEGNEGLDRGQKKRGGQLKLWFMLPPELKSQMLDPDQYTRLPIPYMASLRTIPGLALYEICRRYVTNPGGVTNRDTWQTWWRVLTGSTVDSEPPEYKYAKRDVFKRGAEEVNKITDIEIELIEYKVGKFVRDLQFSVRTKQQADLNIGPPPIDAGLLSRVTSLGISISEAERLTARHSEANIVATLDLVEGRLGQSHLPKIESPAAYFKKALRDRYAESRQQIESAKTKKLEERKTKQLEQRQVEIKAEQENARIHQTAMEAFDTLPEERRRALLEEFGTTLVGPTLASFRKSGIETRMLNAAFSGWLLRKGV